MDIADFKVSGVAEPAKVSLPNGSTPPVNSIMSPEQIKASLQTETQEAQPVKPVESAASAEPAPQAEVKAEEEKQVEKKIDPKFSILARKEAALQRQREQLKAEKMAVEAAAKQAAEYETARKMAKENPIKALEALGLSYEAITEHVMNKGKTESPVDAEVRAVREEVERLKRETEDARRQAEEAAQQRLAAESQAVIDSFRKNAVNYVLSNAEKYELTIANEQANLVYEVIEQDFKDRGGGEVMPVEKAAELVEKYFERRQERIAATKKFQAKFGQKPSVSAEAPQQSASTPAPKRTSTLSNAMTASTPAAPVKHRTEQDRIKAALARLEGR